MKSCKFEKSIGSSLVAALLLFTFYSIFVRFFYKDGFSNIVIYGGGLLLFVVVFFVTIIWLEKVKDEKYSIKTAKVLPWALILLGLGYALLAYLAEGKYEYGDWLKCTTLRHIIPIWLYFIVLAAFSAGLIKVLSSGFIAEGNKKYRLIISSILVLVQTWELYCPNFLTDIEQVPYHIHAYTNSILNAVSLVPYTENINSVYGHYGIFFVIPVKLLHLIIPNKWMCVNLSIMFFGCIAFIAAIYAINKVVRNDLIFTLAALALAMPSFQVIMYVYLQLLPNRMLFPSLILCGSIISLEHKESRKLKILMWGLVILGLIWNFESGLVSGIVWAVCDWYIGYTQKGKVLIPILKEFIMLGVAGVASYLLFALFNYVVGGVSTSIETFLFPLVTNPAQRNFVESLQDPFQYPTDPYFLVIVVFVSTFCVGFYRLIKKDINDKIVIGVLASIMGMGLFTYYINHALSGIRYQTIACLPFVIVLSIVGEYGKEKGYLVSPKKVLSGEGIVCLMSLIIVSAMSLASICSVGVSLDKKYYSVQDKDNVDKLAEWIIREVPEEAAGFGECVPELFAYINRKPGFYFMDWSDMRPASLDYAIKQIESSDYSYLLVRDIQEEYVPSDYELISGYSDYNDHKFRLYKK